MAAVFGIATYALGMSAGSIMFGVVSDGKKTRFIFPPEQDPEENEADALIMKNRMKNMIEGSAEEMVSNLSYNLPANISVSEEYSSFKKAESALQDYFSSAYLGDYDPPFTLVDVDSVVNPYEEEEENG
jgi:hypothetical protein